MINGEKLTAEELDAEAAHLLPYLKKPPVVGETEPVLPAEAYEMPKPNHNGVSHLREGHTAPDQPAQNETEMLEDRVRATRSLN